MTDFFLRRMGSFVLIGSLSVAACEAQAPAQSSSIPENASVAARSKALSTLFAEIWQYRLKHSPEFASMIGDKRYNDQLTDYSAKEVNAGLARGADDIQRLGAIDTNGLSDQEKLSSELMMRSLVEAQQGAKFKEWEMPVSPVYGFQTMLPNLVGQLSFDSVKDYDDYIERLKKFPAACSQVMTNLQLGVDDGRVPPKDSLEEALKQTQGIAGQKAEESVFAEPLKKFPKTISAAEQKRIRTDLIEAIQTQVLPTYQRFAKFIAVQYVPYGRKDPGVWGIPSGDAYYAYLIRQMTTLDKTTAQIHQIGLDEVKLDEAEMLTIVKQLGFTDLKSFRTALAANPKEHPQSKEALVTSLVSEGVFEHLPNLRVALVEGGFAWLPSLSWRLDKHYKRLREEVPHLKMLPSEYIRQNIWVTTQPIEEPEHPEDLIATCEWIGWDRIMFSTDYPHWDQDDPRYAFKVKVPEKEKRMLYRDNALSFYNLAA